MRKFGARCLNLKQVGLRDNFFDVGGYSLLAARVIGEINKTLKVHLNIPTFFQNPTIEQLARVLEQKHHVPTRTAVGAAAVGAYRSAALYHRRRAYPNIGSRN